jgi:hypothetical protein
MLRIYPVEVATLSAQVLVRLARARLRYSGLVVLVLSKLPFVTASKSIGVEVYSEKGPLLTGRHAGRREESGDLGRTRGGWDSSQCCLYSPVSWFSERQPVPIERSLSEKSVADRHHSTPVLNAYRLDCSSSLCNRI